MVVALVDNWLTWQDVLTINPSESDYLWAIYSYF